MKPMTQLMGRPILGLPGELGARSVLADLLTGVRAALLTFAAIAVPVLALWVVTPYADDTAAGAGRVACSLWLLGHGAPLTRGAGAAPVTVTPLLPALLTAVLLYREGARIGRREHRHWRAPVAVCAGYLAAATAAVAQCATEGVLRARPLPDLLAVAALVAASLGAGLRSATGPWPLPLGRFADRLPGVPDWARPVGAGPVVRRAAGAGGLALVAAGGLVLAVAALLGAGAAGRSAEALGGGAAGLAGLLLACAVLLPNAVLWAAAYALGPGFAVGTGTVVAPTGTRLAALPEFPLFALLPVPGGAGWQLLACVLPPAAAVVPALLLGRAAGGEGTEPEGRPVWHPVATCLAALGSSVLAGAGAALCAWLAGGALAAGRMSALGPVPWQAGLATAGWLAAVTVPGALLARWWLTRAGAPSWWEQLTALTNRRTARTRAALHRTLTWAADLPSPLTRRRSRD